jgi:hypothetical protein
MNNFNTTFRTFAFQPSRLADLPSLIENYGEPEYDGNILIEKTLACGWDDSSHSKLRALRFPETVSLTELTDGRYAYTALWSLRLIGAVESGLFTDVTELTQEELQALIPVVEESVFEQPIPEPDPEISPEPDPEPAT